ncbi:hypothetical protein FQZ99_25700 [Escherichia coli]|nr:hypothetical protein [Escherichia coli]
MKSGIWKHKKKFKGQAFFAGYEPGKLGKRVVKFKNVVTGKEQPVVYASIESAKKAGWTKI